MDSTPGAGSSRSSTPTPQRPHPTAPFHPHGDTATYRDLLLFEERLKMNAEMLRRRRRRYSIFLYTFLLATLVMAHRLLLAPPQTFVSLRALQGLLAVVLITLVLFFASGMYEEKIRYAHSYLTYSNKALRPLNMHLNTRRPPLLQILVSYLPVPLRPHIHPHIPNHPTSSTSVPIARGIRRTSNSGVQPPIPPSSNPRGELIFSSRVDRAFREGYERYRSAFERRREEKERLERRGYWRIWGNPKRDVPVPAEKERSGTPIPGLTGKPTPTPPHSRRSTPPIPPSSSSAGRRTPSPSPGPGSGLRFEDKGIGSGGRERAESYSFVWTGTKDYGPLKRAP